MKTSEIESLTWLRGLAAAVVVVSHSVRALEVPYHPQDELSGFSLLSAFDLGSLGVALFFVLSGCTLTLSNSQLSPGSPRELSAFYTKRFFRIWPAYVVALLAYLAFRPIFQSLYGEPLGHWVEYQFFAESSIRDLLIYVGLTFNITGPSGLYNNAFWSLPVEFQYYLMFPLFLLSIRALSVFGPAIIAVTLYVLARFNLVPMHDDLVLTLAFTFAAGMALGHLFMQRRFQLNSVFSVATIIILVTLSSLMANNIVRIEFYRYIPSEWIFYGLCAVAMVALVLFGNLRLPRVLLSPALYLGKISYSLYLYHNLLIAIAILGLVHLGIHNEWARVIWICSWAFAGSLLFAAASYRWVEAPGTKLGKKLAATLQLGQTERRPSN